MDRYITYMIMCACMHLCINMFAWKRTKCSRADTTPLTHMWSCMQHAVARMHGRSPNKHMYVY
jgi:hypothetical protein